MTAERVERDAVNMLFTAVDGPPDKAAQPAFERLEKALPSMHGRSFYGYFDPVNLRYVACVERRADDDEAALGLDEGSLPGGTYLRARLKSEPPALYGQIGPTFDRLATEAGAAVDHTRPWLEHYRRHDEADVLVPVQK
jgi:hypothetical protein